MKGGAAGDRRNADLVDVSGERIHRDPEEVQRFAFLLKLQVVSHAAESGYVGAVVDVVDDPVKIVGVGGNLQGIDQGVIGRFRDRIGRSAGGDGGLEHDGGIRCNRQVGGSVILDAVNRHRVRAQGRLRRRGKGDFPFRGVEDGALNADTATDREIGGIG